MIILEALESVIALNNHDFDRPAVEDTNKIRSHIVPDIINSFFVPCIIGLKI
jgi:hypothetical protein